LIQGDLQFVRLRVEPFGRRTYQQIESRSRGSADRPSDVACLTRLADVAGNNVQTIRRALKIMSGFELDVRYRRAPQ
jgi:hypothetical protein